APLLGSTAELASTLRSLNVDTVVLADGGSPELKRSASSIATTCEQELVEFKVLPSYFRIFTSGLQLETMGGTPVLGVSRLPLNRFVNRLLKSVFDVLGAGIGLLLSMPIMVIAGLLVYCELPGPIIYR